MITSSKNISFSQFTNISLPPLVNKDLRKSHRHVQCFQSCKTIGETCVNIQPAFVLTAQWWSTTWSNVWDLLRQFSLTNGSSGWLCALLRKRNSPINFYFNHHDGDDDDEDEEGRRGRLWLYALLATRFLSPPSFLSFSFSCFHFSLLNFKRTTQMDWVSQASTWHFSSSVTAALPCISFSRFLLFWEHVRVFQKRNNRKAFTIKVLKYLMVFQNFVLIQRFPSI